MNDEQIIRELSAKANSWSEGHKIPYYVGNLVKTAIALAREDERTKIKTELVIMTNSSKSLQDWMKLGIDFAYEIKIERTRKIFAEIDEILKRDNVDETTEIINELLEEDYQKLKKRYLGEQL